MPTCGLGVLTYFVHGGSVVVCVREKGGGGVGEGLLPAPGVGAGLLALGLVVVRLSFGSSAVEELRRLWKQDCGLQDWQPCIGAVGRYPGCQCSGLSGCEPGVWLDACKAPLVWAVGQL